MGAEPFLRFLAPISDSTQAFTLSDGGKKTKTDTVNRNVQFQSFRRKGSETGMSGQYWMTSCRK